jgi:coenzyme F420-reducing hydrogenase alpha subunit
MNLTNGTLGGFKGEPTKETRKKLSESQKGKELNQETKDKIRNTLTGKKQTSEHISNMKKSKVGYKHSNETREKIGNSRRYMPLPSSKRFEAYNYISGEFIGVFETQTECALLLNIRKGGISDVLKGKYKQHKGFSFIFI